MPIIILHPTPEGTCITAPFPGLEPYFVALKDVPAGVPFLLVDAGEIPAEPDWSDPHGVGMGAEAVHAMTAAIAQAAAAYAQAQAEVQAKAAAAEEERLAAQRAEAAEKAKEALFREFSDRLKAEQEADTRIAAANDKAAEAARKPKAARKGKPRK